MLQSAYSMLIDPLLADQRNYVVDLAGIQAGLNILDVGSGTGAQVFAFAGKGASAVGIDSNLRMVRLANQLKVKYGTKNATFKVGSALSLPFADDTFDIASISLVLHENNSGERDRIVSEMKRVVKQGGKLIMIDFLVPLPRNLPGYFIRTVEFLVGKTNYRCFLDYIEQDGLEGILDKCGLIKEKEAQLMSGVIAVVIAKNT